jgi:hypothetical protein
MVAYEEMPTVEAELGQGAFRLTRSQLPPTPVLLELTSLHLSGPMTEVATFMGGMELPTGSAIFIACQQCRLGDELDRILKAAFQGLAQVDISQRGT